MEETISFKDLILVLLRKIKFIIVAMLVFALLGGSLKFFPGLKNFNSDEVKSQQNITYNENLVKYNTGKSNIQIQIKNLEQNITDTEKYLKESLLLQINPYYEYVSECQLYFNMGSDKSNSDVLQQLPNYYFDLAKSGELPDKIAQTLSVKYDAKYIKELYSVNLSNDIISIKAIGNDAAQPNEIVQLVFKYLQENQKSIENSVGKHNIVVLNQSNSIKVDNDLIATQNAKKDMLTKFKADLLEKNTALKALVEPVSEKSLLTSIVKSTIVYMCLGAFLGAFLGIFIIWGLFFISNKAINKNIIKKKFNISYLANLPVNAINNTKYSFMDRLIGSIEGNLGVKLSQKEHLEKLKIKLLFLISETTDSNILITGSIDSEYLEQICGLLRDECKEIKNLTFDYGKNIVMSAETMKKLLTSTSVILVEQQQKSSLDIVEQEIESIIEMKKAILGYIML